MTNFSPKSASGDDRTRIKSLLRRSVKNLSMVPKKLYRNTLKYANKLITFSFHYNDFACQYFVSIDCDFEDYIDCVFEDEIETAEGESRSVYFLWRNCSFVPLLSDGFYLIDILLPFHATSVLLLNFFTSKESHNFTIFFSSVGCRFWSNKAGCCVVFETNIAFNCIIVSTVDFRAGIQCHTSPMVSRDSILAPSLNTSNNTCFLQGNSMLFSCRAARPGVIRVCPCRSYRKEQVALCESCWRNSL